MNNDGAKRLAGSAVKEKCPYSIRLYGHKKRNKEIPVHFTLHIQKKICDKYPKSGNPDSNFAEDRIKAVR